MLLRIELLLGVLAGHFWHFFLLVLLVLLIILIPVTVVLHEFYHVVNREIVGLVLVMVPVLPRGPINIDLQLGIFKYTIPPAPLIFCFHEVARVLLTVGTGGRFYFLSSLGLHFRQVDLEFVLASQFLTRFCRVDRKEEVMIDLVDVVWAWLL